MINVMVSGQEDSWGSTNNYDDGWSWTRDQWILETGRDPWADPMDPPWFTYSSSISAGMIDIEFEPIWLGDDDDQSSIPQSIEITGKRGSSEMDAVCTVSVGIASAGTPTADGDKSFAGHAWYTVSCPSEIENGWQEGPHSYGFSPRNDKRWLVAPGEINPNGPDHNYYKSYDTITFSISVPQAEAMRSFGQDPFSNKVFSSFYNAFTNSCVDFVWKALEIGGINKSGFQGTVYPTDNLGWLRSLDPITGQFSLVPYDPSKVDSNTLLPKEKETKGEHNTSFLSKNHVLFFNADSLGQISSFPIVMPNMASISTYGDRDVFAASGTVYRSPLGKPNSNNEIIDLL